MILLKFFVQLHGMLKGVLAKACIRS